MAEHTYTANPEDLAKLIKAYERLVEARNAVNEAKEQERQGKQVHDPMGLSLAVTEATTAYKNLFGAVAMKAVGPKLDQAEERKAQQDIKAQVAAALTEKG